MSDMKIEHYKIEQGQILKALQIRTHDELKSLTDHRYALGHDACWTIGIAGGVFSTSLILSVQGAWIGLFVAVLFAIAAVVAGANDAATLGVVLLLGVLGGLAILIRTLFKADIQPFMTSFVIALAVGLVLIGTLRGYRAFNRHRKNGSMITRLMQDVTQFHDAVDLAILQADLSKHGAAPPPSDTLHRALAATRTSLLRALAVHGALRTNGALLKRTSTTDPAGRFLPGSADQVALEAEHCADMLSRDLEALAAARIEIVGMR